MASSDEAVVDLLLSELNEHGSATDIELTLSVFGTADRYLDVYSQLYRLKRDGVLACHPTEAAGVFSWSLIQAT